MKDLLLCLAFVLLALLLARSLSANLTAITTKPARVDVSKVRL